jgi:hypothetical protein
VSEEFCESSNNFVKRTRSGLLARKTTHSGEKE